MSRWSGAVVAQVAALAAPFIAVSVWLGLVVAAFDAASVVQGAVSSVALAMAVVLISRAFGRWGVASGALLYVVGTVLFAADGVSWIIQGSSFNERFFAHVNVGNIPVSMEAYPLASLGVVTGLLVVFTMALLVLRGAARHSMGKWACLPALALMAVALLIDAPPQRLYSYFAHAERTESLAGSAYGARIRSMLDPHPSRPDEIVAKPGRNLVFVYLESVERIYTDQHRFPGLTPNINRLRRQGLDFSGLATFPGVTYTIAGLFSSQCGAPYLIDSIFGDDFGKLGFVPNNDNTTTSSFHPELACFGDVLHAAGYDQTFLSGVALTFANKGTFFKLHGYDQTFGKPQIEALHDGKLVTEGWGLHDSDLFDEALAQYRRKQATSRPFSVVLSTVDTHPPRGYLLPGCKPCTAIRNDMLDAVHCTDQLLGRFIEQLSREPGWEDTLVVVMSDHVSMRNVASPLYPPDDQRQPLLFVLNAGRGDRPARMYHMDIAPTVLALLGVHSNVHFMAGADRGKLNAKNSPLPADDVAQAVLRAALWKERDPLSVCANGTLVAWDGEGNLDIGGRKLPVMLGGYPVTSIPKTKTLLVFLDNNNAQLQILSRGGQSPWLRRARAQGGSIFQATPFVDDDGKPALALDWLAPSGGWASLGKVPGVQNIQLRSPRCRAQLDTLAAAKPGVRLDFSETFGTTAIPATREHRPGYVISSLISREAPSARTSAFMFARMASEQPGLGTIHVNRMKRIAVTPSHDHAAMVEFDVSGLTSLKLEPRIDNLMGSCVSRSDTGIVGVRLSLDGEPVMPRFIVDRHSGQELALPLNGSQLLGIEVDEGNGKPDCDYFAIGFSDIVANQDWPEEAGQAGAMN